MKYIIRRLLESLIVDIICIIYPEYQTEIKIIEFVYHAIQRNIIKNGDKSLQYKTNYYKLNVLAK